MKLSKRIKEKLRAIARPGGRARRYVRRGMSCEAFFSELQARKIRYVVLRWFDALPEIEPGEDIDMLVADDDLPKIADLFVRFRAPLKLWTNLKCDVYSLTGLPGSDFRKMAYYPPYLAEGIIARSVTMHDLFQVPAKRDHFLSIAFHALYHKGYASGLPTALTPATPPKKLPDHDYCEVLARLARELSVDVEIDMESLDDYLAEEGWRPPFDMLARLALWNPWIHDRHLRDGLTVEPPRRGVGVFLVRERAIELARVDDMEGRLEAQGFRILHTATIEPERRKAVGERMRGGNWGKGPWKHSGGLPAQVVVVWDPEPLPVDPGKREKYPLVENGRILRAKVDLREHMLRGLEKRDKFNPVHSADNDFQAWEYIDIVLPDNVDELSRQVEALQSGATV